MNSISPSNNTQSTDNILKVAVKWTNNIYKKSVETIENGKPNFKWVLLNFDRNLPLGHLISNAMLQLELDRNGDYAFLMIPDNFDSTYPHYVTEENRNEIVNGSVIYIYHSVKKVAEKLFQEFEAATESHQRMSLLEQFLWHSYDPTFVGEFESNSGFKWLINGIHNGLFEGPELCFALDIFLKSMDHDIIHWSSIDKHFIEKVASNIYNSNNISKAINESSGNPNPNSLGEVERKTMTLSLSILEAAVINCAGKFVMEIERQVSLPNLNLLLKYEEHPEIQQNVLALINSILSRTDSSKRRAMTATLNSRQFKDKILQHIVNRSSENDKLTRGSEITHQLYVLQTLLLRATYEERLSSGASFDEAREKVMDIRNNYVLTNERDGFEMKGPKDSQASLFRSQTSLISNTSSNSGSMADFSDDFERMGFVNVNQPWEVFYEPSGALVLELLHYFSKAHTDAFVRFVIENLSPGDRHYNCPLVVASFRLTNLLCGLLGVGKSPRDEGKEFYPMLFTTDRPMEELFSVGLSLFNRTWHEIHATDIDIDIVCDFLREKLYKTLANSHATTTFESFQKELSKITYAEINRHWNEERIKRDRQKEELVAIKELKTLLQPEMIDIVRQHRLNYLTRGNRFDKYTTKGQRLKDKFWYCRLSSNHKTLLFGDCDEDHKNLDDILVNKFNISDIEQLVTGKDCPHMRDTKGKKSTTTLAFALISGEDSVRNLCFVAPNSEVFDYWIDGINALLEREMNSNGATKDAEMLLELDIKLRLLDIEGLAIPEKAPELPPSPPNYEFSYKPTNITSTTNTNTPSSTTSTTIRQ